MQTVIHLGRVLMLMLVVLVLGYTQAFGQEYGVIDTVWKDATRTPSYTRSFGDTIVFIGGGRSTPNRLFFSENAGTNWDTLQEVDLAQQALPGVGIFAATINSNGRGRILLFRGRELVYDDTVGTEGKVPPFPVVNLYVHPLRPQIVFLKYVYAPSQLATFNPIYYRTSDTSEWIQFETPRSWFGDSRRVNLSFDFTRLDRIWVTINGSDFSNRDLPNENYYTEDFGETYHFVSVDDTLPAIIGALRDGYGVKYKYSIVRGEGRVTDLFLENPETDSIENLSWYENMVRDLLPNTDTSTVFLSFWDPSSGPAGYSWEHSFNVLDRSHQALGVTVDSLIDGVWVPTYGVATTIDSGKSWLWLLKPNRTSLLYARHMTFDVVTKSYYVALRTAPSPTEEYRYGVLLHISPSLVNSVTDASRIGEIIKVAPNPASSFVLVTSTESSLIDRIVLFNSVGEVVLLKNNNMSVKEVMLNLDEVSSGVYFLTAFTGSESFGKILIIQH